ncbi:MAG: AraC family transcriptional regulator [Cohaesibacter sp.]|nr:AraC family transcriptional regulator [Cohaesibacter sp.]
MIVQISSRSPTSIRMLCDAAARQGIDMDVCLEKSGITAEQLMDPNTRHTTEQELQVISNYIESAGNRAGLGWNVGKDMHVNAFGIWGFALQTSPTLRAALQIAVDYIKLSFIIADMRLSITDKDAYLIFDMTGLQSELHRFIFERHAAVAFNFFEEMIQKNDKDAFALEVIHGGADYVQALAQISGLEVASGCSAYALKFPSDLLDRPLPKSDPVSLKFCLEQCKALAEKMDEAMPPWSKKVRDLIVEDIASEHKIEAICEKLTVTERTLRRRLSEEGTSFRELYTDIRMALAYELLDVAGLNVETVAWRVGYTETASFIRAFSRKFSQSPGEVRKRP